MSAPAIEAAERTWIDRDAAENDLHRHQPVLSMKDGSIAGCQCMDRVFYRDREDWGSHLAEVCNGLMEAAAREALKPIREFCDGMRQMFGHDFEIHIDDLAPYIYTSEELS